MLENINLTITQNIKTIIKHSICRVKLEEETALLQYMRLNNLNIQKVLRNQRKIYALTKKKLYIGYKSQNKNYK